ncbi:cytochrome P450 monooxygenase [Cordyceps militaris]|uniref:Cytochrome P450 monooxygenase n=1 Tax=Cordyceps militaris TaxID=73501 RepID=A0A2H4SJI0_CORMI|nr:cytochrome P450 monooxygenase [Cordyceps militaris]
MTSLHEFCFEVIRDGNNCGGLSKDLEYYGNIDAKYDRIKDTEYYGNIYTVSARKVNKDPATVGPSRFQHQPRRPSTTTTTMLGGALAASAGVYGNRPGAGLRLGLFRTRCRHHHRAAVGENLSYVAIPNFQFVITEAFLVLDMSYHLARFIPGVVSLFKRMPIAVIPLTSPPVAELLTLQDHQAENTPLN